MTDERWQEVVEMVQKNFSNVELTTEELIVNTPDGPQVQGTEDILEFDNPMGRFRLVRQSKPAIVDKKMHYSHRQGDTARTEYVLSDTELSHKLIVYKENYNGDWDEVSADTMGL